jgi:FtsH-binding integral membrane protein
MKIGDGRMTWVTENDRFMIALRYASVALSLLVLWVQSSLGRSQNALVICMISAAAFMMMVNRLTNKEDRGPKMLVLLLAAFVLSFLILFVNEMTLFLSRGILQSTLVICAAVSGVGGGYLAQRRSNRAAV